MDPSGGRDSRYNLNYSLGMMAGESPDSIYGNPNVTLARPPSGNLNVLMGGRVVAPGGLQSTNNNNNNNNNSTSPGSLQCGGGGGGGLIRGMKRTNSDCYDDRVMTPGQTTLTGLETVNCGPNSVMGDGLDDGYTSLQPAHNNHGQHHINNNNHSPVGQQQQQGQQGQQGQQQQQQQQQAAQPNKKSPPSNGKKTKGRVKIKMEYIDNKLRRYTTFSKRKTGIMKKVRIIKRTFMNLIEEIGGDRNQIISQPALGKCREVRNRCCCCLRVVFPLYSGGKFKCPLLN